MTSTAGAPPQLSPDGHWWWDGQQWCPHSPEAQAATAQAAAQVATAQAEAAAAEAAARSAQLALPAQPVGHRSALKRAAEHLNRPVAGAALVLPPGHMARLMGRSAFGGVGALVAGAVHQASAKRAAQAGVQITPLDSSLLALTPEGVHLIHGRGGRSAKGRPPVVIDYQDVAGVRLGHQKVTTQFEILLRSGQALRGETSRIGRLRSNPQVLELLGRLAAAATPAGMPQATIGELPVSPPIRKRFLIAAGTVAALIVGIAVAAALTPAEEVSTKGTLSPHDRVVTALLRAQDSQARALASQKRYTNDTTALTVDVPREWNVSLRVVSVSKSRFCLAASSEGTQLFVDSSNHHITDEPCR